MTEEEKLAEEYAKTSTNCYKDCLADIDDKSVLEEAIADAFVAGLKAGIPKWHKVADGDLPKYDVLGDSVSITVLNQNGNKVFYNFLEKVWKLESNNKISKVIAWCEIPKYTEE